MAMTATPEKFEIACYLGWCGAEATFPFSKREDYDRTRTALEKLAAGHARENELPSRSTEVPNLYFIDAKDRDAFNQIMEAYAGRK